jgi:hypothetical protein
MRQPARHPRGLNYTGRDPLLRVCKELGMDVARDPHFPARVLGAEGRRPDLNFRDWEEEKDSQGYNDNRLAQKGAGTFKTIWWPLRGFVG